MPPPSRHGAETQAATPTTAAAISRNAGHWRRVSISIDSFQATISCAISSVISSSFTPSDLRMRFASKLDLFLRHGRCLRLCDSTQPCSRLPRRPYGRSIPISCSRRQEPKKRKRGFPRRNDPTMHAPPAVAEPQVGLHSRASTRGKSKIPINNRIAFLVLHLYSKLIEYGNRFIRDIIVIVLIRLPHRHIE